MQFKSSETSQRPQKPRQGDQLIHRSYTKSSPHYLNFSLRFGARSKSVKIKSREKCGTMVAIGDAGGCVVAQNRDRIP